MHHEFAIHVILSEILFCLNLVIFYFLHKKVDKIFRQMPHKEKIVQKIQEKLDILESRNNDRLGQMEVRLTTLLGQSSAQQTEATWALKEKLLLIEHKNSKRDPEAPRPRGRPRKER